MNIKKLSNREFKTVIQESLNPVRSSNNELDNFFFLDLSIILKTNVKRANRCLSDVFNLVTKKEKEMLKVILANLYRAYKESSIKPVYVAVSLRKAEYTNKNLRYKYCSYEYINKIIKVLEYNNLIHLFKGVYSENLKRRTRIIATDDLIDIFEDNCLYIDNLKPVNYITVKKDKRLVKPSNKNIFNRKSNQLDKLNRLMGQHIYSVRFPYNNTHSIHSITGTILDTKPVKPNDNDELKQNILYSETRIDFINNALKSDKKPDFWQIEYIETWLTRVYANESLTEGGRFYTKLQQLKREFRLDSLKIDDEAIVELDYSACHTLIAYSMDNLKPEGHPYLIEGFDRKHVKDAINIMYNSKSNTSAARALVKKYNNEFNYQYFVNVVNAVESKHEPIAPYFYTMAWKELTYIESSIAEDIIKRVLSQGEGILPLHDGFCVRKTAKNLLHQAMYESFIKRTGINPIIKGE